MQSQARNPIGPWSAIGLVIAAFIALEIVLPMARTAVTAHVQIRGPRDIVAMRAAGSIVLVWALFGSAWLVLRLRGQNLHDIGWGRPARLWGWLLAVLFAALYGGFTLFGMMHAGAPVATDWSFFRIAVALGIGISAGICEETVFRGFVMTQGHDAGLHWSLQILLSAVLFGLAHFGWGGMGAHFQVGQAVGAAAATIILGVMMAVTYLAGSRSLAPAIFAHGAIDVLIEPWLLLYAVTGGHF